MQCLSTFYLENKPELSKVHTGLISEFCNLSQTCTQSVVEDLQARGALTFSSLTGLAALDLLNWSRRGAKTDANAVFLSALATNVHNSPTSLTQGYQKSPPVLEECCARFFDATRNAQGATTTVASAHSQTFVPESSDPPRNKYSREILLNFGLAVKDIYFPTRNLWVLVSWFSSTTLFRRQLRVMYSGGPSGQEGKTYAQLANSGRYTVFCVNDDNFLLSGYRPEDLLGMRQEFEVSEEKYVTLGGVEFRLSGGIAAFTINGSDFSVPMKSRGTARKGIELIELDLSGVTIAS